MPTILGLTESGNELTTLDILRRAVAPVISGGVSMFELQEMNRRTDRQLA